MPHRQLSAYVTLIIFMVSLLPEPAMAYIGPGAGLTAIGAFLAVVVGLIAALFGFMWYPLKRLIRKWKKRGHDTQAGDAE